MDDKLYSLQEVAKILRVSERSIFRYIHGGRLRATKIGYWRISLSDLKAFLGANANTNIYNALIERQATAKRGELPKRKKKKPTNKKRK